MEQNDTTRTEEIGLNGTEQAAEESAAPSESENTDTAADVEQAAAPETASESENKETAADSTAHLLRKKTRILPHRSRSMRPARMQPRENIPMMTIW